jgi:protein TonB
MLAYAAHARRNLERRSSPNAMLAIVAAHVALIAAVMSIKMDLPAKVLHPPLTVDLITEDNPPPAVQHVEPRIPQQPVESTIDRPRQLVPSPPVDSQIVDATPSLPNFDDLIGSRLDPPRTDLARAPAPVKLAAQLITSPSELKPPYPHSKILSEEEALLRLRLTIDERGRVINVEPLGHADPAFLDSARRHLLPHWRYRPASEDGRPVSSSIVISMRFSLEG